ncbi:hypothetical protein D9M72_434900 [compost metagenome]
MIGHQQTGAIQGMVITTVSHEGLRVSVDGKSARLTIVLDDGTAVNAGERWPGRRKRLQSTAIAICFKERAFFGCTVSLWRLRPKRNEPPHS